LINDGKKVLLDVQRDYAGLGLEGRAGLNDEETRTLLLEAGLQMLEELRGQKEQRA